MEVATQHNTDESTEFTKKLPLKLQLSYGVGHVLNDVCSSMWFTYLLVFFHLVLEFDNWETGFMLLVGQVADALATVIVGYHSDRSDIFSCCNYGRRKVWHLLGTICVLGAFPFIFSPCIGCKRSLDWIRISYYCVFIIIFQFGWAAVQNSHLSLIPELTPIESMRTKLCATRYCFTVLSNLLVYIMTWIVFNLNNEKNSKLGPSDGPKFQTVFWSVLLFGSICSLIFHLFVKENNSGISNRDRGKDLRSSMSDIFRNKKIYKIAVVYMSTQLFVNLTQVFIPLYLNETLDMAASSLSLVPLILYIGSFLASFFVGILNRYAGRRIAYLVGALLGLTACIWIQFGNGHDFKTYYIHVIAILIGSAVSVLLVTSLGVTTDLIGEKTDSGAFVYGIMSFTDKLSNGIAVAVIQYLHNDACNTNFYKDVLTIVCGGAVILGTVAVYM